MVFRAGVAADLADTCHCAQGSRCPLADPALLLAQNCCWLAPRPPALSLMGSEKKWQWIRKGDGPRKRNQGSGEGCRYRQQQDPITRYAHKSICPVRRQSDTAARRFTQKQDFYQLTRSKSVLNRSIYTQERVSNSIILQILRKHSQQFN